MSAPQPSSRRATTGVRDPLAGELAASARIDATCRVAVAGKQALRQLAAWVRGCDATETEFRVLWTLATAADATACDQVRLAARLAISEAQISGVVERLHARDLIEHDPSGHDRRRQPWRITPAGRALVASVVAAVSGLPVEPKQEAA